MVEIDKVYLEYTDVKSDKFYNVSVLMTNNQLVVQACYDRMTGKGRTRLIASHPLDGIGQADIARCVDEGDKVLRSKVKKGYESSMINNRTHLDMLKILKEVTTATSSLAKPTKKATAEPKAMEVVVLGVKDGEFLIGIEREDHYERLGVCKNPHARSIHVSGKFKVIESSAGNGWFFA